MSRSYLTPDQAVSHFTDRAADCDRKGLVRCAESYRAAAEAASTRLMAVCVDGAALKQTEGTR